MHQVSDRCFLVRIRIPLAGNVFYFQEYLNPYVDYRGSGCRTFYYSSIRSFMGNVSSIDLIPSFQTRKRAWPSRRSPFTAHRLAFTVWRLGAAGVERSTAKLNFFPSSANVEFLRFLTW
jgi:hypothetical protein